MAVTITPEELAPLIGGKLSTDPTLIAEPRVGKLLEAATAHVLRYAPGAPDAAHNEAVTRLAGYLAQSDYGAVVSDSIGPMATTHKTNHADLFRSSGAAALLAPWRVRRAGAV